MTEEHRDITIIGGGPTGLFAAFYAGMRGVSARIIDSLPELGGQLMALYPEKYVYDVGGFPRITAKDLGRNLIEQGTQFGPDIRLEEQVDRLEPQPDGKLVVVTNRGSYSTGAVVIAGGKGAFAARELGCPGYNELIGKGVAYHVKDPAAYQGKRVLIVGGGDSAVDWVLNLKERTDRLVLIHRREGFRAHAHSMRQLNEAVERGEVEMMLYHEVREIHGTDRVEGATIYDNRTDQDTRLDVDAVLALIGFKPDLGPIATLGARARAELDPGRAPHGDEHPGRLRGRRHRDLRGQAGAHRHRLRRRLRRGQLRRPPHQSGRAREPRPLHESQGFQGAGGRARRGRSRRLLTAGHVS